MNTCENIDDVHKIHVSEFVRLDFLHKMFALFKNRELHPDLLVNSDPNAVLKRYGF